MISSLKLNKVIFRSLATQANLTEVCPHANGSPSIDPVKAKPFEKIPVISKYSLIRGFLPGGEFYGKNHDDLYRTIRSKFGDVFIFPGMFGKKDILMTFHPDDFATIFRTEGAWPVREGLETLTYHRKVRSAEFFGNIGGLVTE